MTIPDILTTLQWWSTLFILGLGFLPLTFLLFNKFFDKGYIFSKILGLTLLSYIILLVGLFHIVPFSYLTGSIIFFALVAIQFYFLRKKQNLLTIFKQFWKILLIEELLFFITIFFWAYIHTFAPDINGLEKYMDFGFINSILRSEYFPPQDMWFPPFPINYYYFGHLMTAVLTKLSNLPSNLTFNLMLSTIFAFCFTQAFSIAANLYNVIVKQEKFLTIKRIIAGIISASLVTFAGNLHMVYAFFKAYPNESPVPLWQLPFLPFSFPNAYWYPNATRFIHNTIHEFPMYSWTVADLHGHVLDIPVVLLTIAVLLAFFLNTKENKKSKTQTTKRAGHSYVGYLKLLGISKLELLYLLPISFLLAVMYMTNAWDGAIYFLLAFATIFYLNSQKGINYKKIITTSSLILLGFFVFVTPFNIHFKPFVSGIGVLCAPDMLVNMEHLGPFMFEADHCQHSPWWQLLMLYGFFYFFVLSFLIFTIKTKKLFSVDQFVLLLILLSTILLIIPELLYVKDIYPAHYRANTMFKLAFQAFIMLSLTSGYIMVRLISEIKNQRSKIVNFYSAFFLVSLFLYFLVMLYPYQAVNSYYGNLQNSKNLDGTAYLQTTHPGDYEAIQWLNTHVKGQPVILEAHGDSYTDFSRISANTGLPTLLGWTVHEWLWRGTYDIPAPRIEEIKTIYTTTDSKKTAEVLQKYNVRYVIVGELEHQQYPELEEKKFLELGRIVFQKEGTKIYQLQ